MKAISFEAIRNLLRTKKKSADDYGDASFKRSDSFKRISIRRSYLNRGRKRAIHASKLGAQNANQNGKMHANAALQEHHSNVEIKVPFIDQHVDVHVNHSSNSTNNNNNVREQINRSSRIEEATQPQQIQAQHQQHQHHYYRCPEIDANIKNVRNKSSKESMRSSAENRPSISAGAIAGADERLKVQRRSSKSKRNNKYDEEMTTSTSCFVKAGNMLKKPIGIGLDVTTADSIDRAVNSKYSAQRDPFNEILRSTEMEFDPNQKQRFVYKSRPKSLAPLDDLQSNRVCIRQPNSNYINASNRSSDFVNFNDSNSENIWSAHRAQQSPTSPVISKSTYSICNDERNTRSPDDEMPSFVIFKTFSNEQNASGYLETCFNNTDDESKKRQDHIIPMQNNTYTKKYNNVAGAVLSGGDVSSRKGNGVVIQISDNGCNIDNLSHLQIKEALNKKVSRDSALGDNLQDYSEDETSLNGKFTFEIYKQMRTSKNADDPKSSKKYPFNQYDRGGLKSFDSHINASDSTQSTAAMNDSFASMHICDKIDNNFFLEPDTHEFNDVNVIPYPLRIKTNPFTNQKEPYSVNLGRVWKQLNLGQDDQSLETSIEKSNSKVKNDSFRSISSHDSGFSLTLTKQKSLFNRKHQKKSSSSKRKAKATLTRDGQFKKLPTFQSNGVRRSKRNQFKQRTSPINVKSHIKSVKKDPIKSISPLKCKTELERNPCETFLDRYYNEIQQKLNKDEDKAADYSFSQEISDLEAFFEEHLKRLKEYYLQKKKINDQTIDEICSKCEGKRIETNAISTPTPTPAPTPTELNQSNELTTSRNNNTNNNNNSSVCLTTRSSHMDGGSVAIDSNRYADAAHRIVKSKLSHDLWQNENTFNNFDFPYPDKRNGTNPAATHKKNHNSHTKMTVMMNEIRISNDLDYASLDFSSHLQNKKLEPPAWNDALADNFEYEHLKNLNDDDLLKEKQSMIVNYNSGGEFLLDGCSDDEYEDILNDDELTEDGVCVLCDKIRPECECSMNRRLANAYSITPENILCNCMGALNAPMLKPNYAKNSKTVKKSNTSKSRLNSRKAKRSSKRKKWPTSKNHSLRRDFCNVASKYQRTLMSTTFNDKN